MNLLIESLKGHLHDSNAEALTEAMLSFDETDDDVVEEFIESIRNFDEDYAVFESEIDEDLDDDLDEDEDDDNWEEKLLSDN